MTQSTARVFRTVILSLWAVAAFPAAVSVAWGQPVNLDAAKKEGKVVIYGTIVPQVMTLIEKGFEGKYGVKIEYWRADATKVHMFVRFIPDGAATPLYETTSSITISDTNRPNVAVANHTVIPGARPKN